MKSAKKPSGCPYCGSPMRIVAMACDACEVEIRGAFRQTQFARMAAEDAQFLESYLLAGFSIKALAEQSGMGYVAIRNRLDRVIESYRRLRENEEAKRRILERLDRGEISASEAAEQIERL